MKEYQHRKEIVKAVKYQEGMEDAWVVEYETYNENDSGTGRNIANKIFMSKDEARKYMCSPTDESIMRNFCKYTNAIPVLLHEISEDEYDYGCFVIATENGYYEYEELEEDSWLTLTENGVLHEIFDTETFFENYETPFEKSVAHIGYDRDLEELYVEMNCIRIAIDETEIATVEKLLDGFGISFTEKVGQAFIDKFVMKGDVYAD